jgi:hypothetical protein
VLVAVGGAAEVEPPRAGAPLAEAGHDGWNAAPDEYAFRYRKEGAAAAQGTVVLKALVVGDKLLVDAAPPSSGAAAHVELRRARARRRRAQRAARAGCTLRPCADTCVFCAVRTASTSTPPTTSAPAPRRRTRTWTACWRACAPACCRRCCRRRRRVARRARGWALQRSRVRVRRASQRRQSRRTAAVKAARGALPAFMRVTRANAARRCCLGATARAAHDSDDVRIR